MIKLLFGLMILLNIGLIANTCLESEEGIQVIDAEFFDLETGANYRLENKLIREVKVIRQKTDRIDEGMIQKV